MTVPPKKKNVLFGFFVGKDSIFSEALSDECMIDIIAEMFTKFFPKINIPRPKAIVRYLSVSEAVTFHYNLFKKSIDQNGQLIH